MNSENLSDNPAYKKKRLYIHHKKVDPDHCGRCEILYSLDYPRVEGKDICDECEYEIENGRMNHPRTEHLIQSVFKTIVYEDTDFAAQRRIDNEEDLTSEQD